MRSNRTGPVLALTLLCSGTCIAEGLAPLRGALGELRPLVDARLRLESVDQAPFGEDATSVTLRGRLGFETGRAWNTALLVEGEAVVPLDSDYNSTTNLRTRFPVVADPESYELNRLQLVNTSIRDTTLTLGRQRLVLDDQRFVGNVGWRQNEQTFDALRVVNRTLPNLTIDLSYVEQVNRVFGRDGLPGANIGRYHGDNVLANVAWQTRVGKLTGFTYLLDFKETPGVQDSTQTYGLRFAGERPLADIRWSYLLSAATQRAYRGNPLSFSNDYLLAELTGTFRRYSLGVGLERLDGTGVKGFTTPLATLHRFQGWADKFLTTPVNGIQDAYLNAGYQTRGLWRLDSLSLSLSWHRYDSQRASIDYGDELDLQLQARYQRTTATLKFADYRPGAGTPLTLRDTRKLWAQVDFAW